MLISLTTKIRALPNRTVPDPIPFFLLLVAAAFMSRALLSGGVVLPGDLIFSWYPWARVAPSDFRSSNPILTDPVTIFHPWRIFTLHSAPPGEIPLWNPYVGGGAPFLGNGQSQILFPFNLLYYVLPFHLASTLSLVFVLFFAGLFMHAFMRHAGIGRFGGIVSALSFMFSGTMILWLQFPLGFAAMWAPAIFLACERIIASIKVKDIGILAIPVGLQLLAGHAESSFLCLGSALLYTLFGAYLQRQESGRALRIILYFALGTTLGAGLAAVQILPFYEYLVLSHAYRARGSVEWYFLQPEFIVTNLIPNFFGNPVAHNYWHTLWNYNAINGAYVGSVSLLLALMAYFNKRQRSRAIFFYALALLSFAVVYKVPGVYEAARAIPFLGLMDTTRLLFIAAFSLSVLAGFGADALSSGKVGSRAALVLSVGLVLATYIGLSVAVLLFLSHGIAVVLSAVARLPADVVYSLIRYEGENLVWFTLLTIVAGLLSWLHAKYARTHSSRALLQVAMVIAILVGSFGFGFGYNPVVSSSSVYPTYPVTPAIQLLRNDHSIYRIIGVGCCTLPPNIAMIYGIHDFRMPPSADGLTPETYARFQEVAVGPDFDNPENWNIPLLSLANVKYILTPPGFSSERLPSSVRRAYNGSDMEIYFNPALVPRAFIVFKTVVAESNVEALSTLQTVDLRKTVVLTEPVNLSQHEEPSLGEATILEYANTRVIVETRTSQSGLLIVTDTYFPGWSAYIDDKPTEILQVDYAFRGVVIPPGRHVVEFSYQPASFRLGLIISIASLSATIVVLLRRMAFPLLRSRAAACTPRPRKK